MLYDHARLKGPRVDQDITFRTVSFHHEKVSSVGVWSREMLLLFRSCNPNALKF